MTDERHPLEAWTSALGHSHRRLSTFVASLDVKEYESPSFASEWTIAQVLSHLGSGAEIFTLFLRAGLNEDPAPGADQFKPIWDSWNGKEPDKQAIEGLQVDATFLQQLGALDDVQRRNWHLSMFGGDQDLAGLLRLRLGEHAVHTWDVVVSRETDAALSGDAVDLLIDTLDQLATRAGKASTRPLRVRVTTHEPDRTFILRADRDGVQLEQIDNSSSEEGEENLELPAESLIRLVYGRLDPSHTPALATDGASLDQLRSLFPGI